MTTLQEYLNNKYPTQEDKETVQEINLEKINQAREQEGQTELLEGGEVDLRAFISLQEVEIYRQFLKTPITKLSVEGLTKLKVLIWPDQIGDSEEEKKLWTELGIADLSTENNKKRKTVKEVRRLAELKSIPVHFGQESAEAEPKEGSQGDIFLLLDKKDKTSNFSPQLIFWTLSQELALIAIGTDKTTKTPDFWKKFAEELIWVKDNLAEEFKKEFEPLLTPATFPSELLDMSELLAVYYPNSENIPDSQTIKTSVNQEIVNQTWPTIRAELIELTSQELKKNPSEEKLKELALKVSIDGSADQQYTIQVNYHSQSPLQDQIKELITTTPLKLEIENLKQKQEQLPTSENYDKLAKQKQALENSLQDLTDEEEFNKIKQKINQIK